MEGQHLNASCYFIQLQMQLLLKPLPTLSLPKGTFLEKMAMQWYRDHYLNSPEEAMDPRVSPLKAESFGELPTAQIVTAGFDPLRDEGAAYAQCLKQAGVSVDYTCYGETIHGFAGMTEVIPSAKRAMEEIAEKFTQVPS